MDSVLVMSYLFLKHRKYQHGGNVDKQLYDIKNCFTEYQIPEIERSWFGDFEEGKEADK